MPFNLEDLISKYRDSELTSPYIYYGLVIFLFCYWWKSTTLENPSGLPVIGRKWYELGNGKAKKRFRDDSLGLVRSCQEKVRSRPILNRCLPSNSRFLSTSMEMLSICILIPRTA